MKYLCTLFLTCLCFQLFSQTILTGIITDKKTDEPLRGVKVVLKQDGAWKIRSATDFDGKYYITLSPGIYDVEFTYIGFPVKLVSAVEIIAEVSNELDWKLEAGSLGFYWHYGIDLIVPLIEKDNTTSGHTYISDDIEKVPTKSIRDVIRMTPGVSVGF